MTERLDQINKQISETEAQRAYLNKTLDEMKDVLARKKTNQEELIISGIDTSKIVAEIVETQVGIEGLFRSINSLNKTLEDLRADQNRESKDIALVTAQRASDEMMNTATNTYLAFCELVEKTEFLKAKSIEFRSTLKPLTVEIKSTSRPGMIENRSIHPEYLAQRLQRVTQMWERLEKELFPLLEVFPKEIFTDKSLPTLDQLTRKLRRR